MASSGEQQDYLNLCSFRELFSGRFDEEEAAFILDHFDRNVQEAINFVLQSEPAEVRQIIEEQQQTWRVVLPTSKRENIARTIDQLKQRPQSHILSRAKSGQIDTLFRLFACRSCDRFWWRRVPNRKMVSKCDRCHQRYDPVPKDREWGWAEFSCGVCGHNFHGWCSMWMPSPCYHCQSPVLPTCILPPLRTNRGHDSQRRYHHRCSAPDCIGNKFEMAGHFLSYGALLGRDNEDELPMTCVYPASRRAFNKPVVVIPSKSHDSTGSTVNTFLPQDDLLRTVEVIPMATLYERDLDDED